jgi:hypothetical protein
MFIISYLELSAVLLSVSIYYKRWHFDRTIISTYEKVYGIFKKELNSDKKNNSLIEVQDIDNLISITVIYSTIDFIEKFNHFFEINKNLHNSHEII